jgi:hypothetical protein
MEVVYRLADDPGRPDLKQIGAEDGDAADGERDAVTLEIGKKMP